MCRIYVMHSSLLINVYIVPILCFNEECYKDCPHLCSYSLCVHIRIFGSYTMSSRKDFQLMIHSGSAHCLFCSFLGFHFYASPWYYLNLNLGMGMERWFSSYEHFLFFWRTWTGFPSGSQASETAAPGAWTASCGLQRHPTLTRSQVNTLTQTSKYNLNTCFKNVWKFEKFKIAHLKIILHVLIVSEGK